ncbi:hypothetical protein [Spirochaeta cellobiosiphila]|nr:hypothetical protein [Spirochaeta cellobiosiphila]
MKTDNGQTGWVYGGYISLNDAVSKEEQEQYNKEHAELVQLAE